ncbi:metalloregulator ArsR/SmtB family transcription factor [Patescibacteria group bacterium]|nr:metalloregulator ArsR/SmtB family transcription factor [Patescibacteria group bacterium]MCL5409822.1 metalloregulator ArsR/SmtB family transcription factor [Patescibacteria group bacterium]
MTDDVLASLANPIRLQLITCLSQGEKNVSQLIVNCGLSQSAVSQHLEKLRKSGLLTWRREGKQVYYQLSYPQLAKISQDLQEFIQEVH